MTDFDPWRPSDLVRFLHACANAEDESSLTTAQAGGDALGITKDQAIQARRRLEALNLLERVDDAPQRVGEGPEDMKLRLTEAGLRAVLSDNIPGIQ